MTSTTAEQQAPLTFGDRERAVLEFERITIWSAPGRRDQAIKDRFGLTPTRYSQLLLRIIDMPEALIWDPVHVRRLQRLREERRSKRRG